MGIIDPAFSRPFTSAGNFRSDSLFKEITEQSSFSRRPFLKIVDIFSQIQQSEIIQISFEQIVIHYCGPFLYLYFPDGDG